MRNIDLSAVSRKSDDLQIFALGLDKQMFHKAWNGNAWLPSQTGWEPLGGGFDSAPAVASFGANRLDIFALGLDDQMFHKAGDGQVWLPSPTGWEPLGGGFNSAPAVASFGANRLDIFALGLDNQMFHKAWDGTWLPSPTDWEPLGGGFNSAPAVASWGANRLDIFALGLDNQMFHKAWDGSAWLPSPTGWEALGGRFHLSRPTQPPPLPDTVTLDSGSITSGLTIGGSARLVMSRGGDFTFSSHMHNSGGLGIDYLLTLVALTPSGIAYTVQHSGHTAGTLTPGSPDDDVPTTPGFNDRIRDNWDEASRASLTWTLHANDTLTPQIGAALEEALQDALKAAAQAATTAVIALL